MTRDTVLGAGGLQSEWAIWDKIQAPFKDVVTKLEEPTQTPKVCEATEVSTLKSRYELLERENELLRERLAIADRQVDVKDSQINDFKAITENLTRQNQVLLMLAQGVPMERIMKGGKHEIEVQTRHDPRFAGSVRRQTDSEKVNKAEREKIISKLQEMASEGMTQGQIAAALNDEGVPTLSGAGQWDRRKVGKMIRIIAA